MLKSISAEKRLSIFFSVFSWWLTINDVTHQGCCGLVLTTFSSSTRNHDYLKGLFSGKIKQYLSSLLIQSRHTHKKENKLKSRNIDYNTLKKSIIKILG